jgi:hypothetical protein
VLKVDGQDVDTHKQPNSIAFLNVADETFDVGVDTRTGKVDKLTFNLGPTQLTEEDQKKVQEGVGKAHD